MARGSNFDVTLDHDGKEYRVRGFVTTYYPGSFYARNGDPGNPPEGGELEDCDIWELEGRKRVERKLSDDEADALLDDDDFYQAVYGAIEEAYGQPDSL